MDAVLARTIDSEQPLPNAMELLMRASVVANQRVAAVPKAQRSSSRQARSFRRPAPIVPMATPTTMMAPVSLAPSVSLGKPGAATPARRPFKTARSNAGGATQFYRARTDIAAAARFTNNARLPAARRASMASAVLMAGSNGRKHHVSPVAHALDVLRARAQAMQVIGTLRHRFAMNALDMADKKPDMARLIQARNRRYMPAPALTYA